MLRRSTCCLVALLSAASAAIDRRAVVARHNPAQAANASAPPDRAFTRSVGNGAFAYSCDALGTQTLNASSLYVNTMADWAWHSAPYTGADPALALRSYNYSLYQTSDGNGSTRGVRYPTGKNLSEPAAGLWLHANPHRVELFQLSVRWASGVALALGDIVAASSALDMYAALADSTATLSRGAGGAATLRVRAAVHPDADVLALRVDGVAAAGTAPLRLRLAFPYSLDGGGEWSPAYDGAHSTAVTTPAPGRLTVVRTMDGDGWRLDCSYNASWSTEMRAGPHVLELVPPPAAVGAFATDLVCLCAPRGVAYPVGATSAPWIAAKAALTRALQAAPALPPFDAVAAAAASASAAFWEQGAFVDLASATDDPRALELERRVVQSLYLLRTLEAGAEPPAESGLLSGDPLYWGGKHHGEMRWFHAAAWPFWQRPALLARSDAWYLDYLPNATSVALSQGYAGARWPKMIAACANRSGSGIDVAWPGLAYSPLPPAVHNGSAAGLAPLLAWESSSGVGPLLVWQQAHTIWLAEAQRRAAAASGGAAAAAAVMAAQAPLVWPTADFLASFAVPDAAPPHTRHLAAPLYGGEEQGDPLAISDPAFELVQIGEALDIARGWRAAMGLPAVRAWGDAVAALAPPPLDPASTPPRYAANAACACLYQHAAEPCAFPRAGCPLPLNSHPMTSGLVGMLNGLAGGTQRYHVDAAVANATTAAVVANWTWGNEESSEAVWGWDLPLVALAQARLGWSAASVVDMLLMRVAKNAYTAVGWNEGMGAGTVYLPGNGATLIAVAALAAGFDGGAPGSQLLAPGAGPGAVAAAPTAPLGFPAAWAAQVEGFNVPLP